MKLLLPEREQLRRQGDVIRTSTFAPSARLIILSTFVTGHVIRSSFFAEHMTNANGDPGGRCPLPEQRAAGHLRMVSRTMPLSSRRRLGFPLSQFSPDRVNWSPKQGP
jgi:hypothetical protein